MRFFLIYFTLILIIVSLAGGLFAFGVYAPQDLFSKEEITFTIEKGKGSREIALGLQERGLIRWGPLFRAYVLLKGISGNLKAGDYKIYTSMNIPQIAEKFYRGEVIKEEITIIEGWNLRDVAFYFENRGMFQAEEIWEVAGFPALDYSKSIAIAPIKDLSSEYDFLKDKPENVNLEGYLFPDTYEVNKDDSVEEIILKMLDNFGKKLAPEIRAEIEKQGKTIFETITMASLIEKEVKTPEDKKIVSGILWKRLKVGMPLQVDATISYITGKKTTKISKEETGIESFYNTYKFQELPLGPICNPGLESILASLCPEESQYWYYLSTPEGETIFSKTLEEHNSAKAKYLKNNE